ncbi:hypothetical protein [Chryseobacterium sp. Mn2064]|uniref:hypothetical protein n=1 Tax=Chryseobacterium sp. Mn2064 TaxID=3395263 RepID=UPI003BC220F0
MRFFFIIFLLFTDWILAQDLEIEIPDKRIELTSENRVNLCYKIKNNSTKYYKVLADSTGFSTGENEAIDEPFLGLLNIRIFDGKNLLYPTSGFYGYQKNARQISTSTQELIKFKELHQLNFKHDYELSIYHDIYKRIVNIPPKGNVNLCTKIGLPIYRSATDDGSLFYDIKNQKEYNLQLHLNIPSQMVRKYTKILNKEPEKYKIFSGEISSNKVNIILVDK